MRDLSPPRAEQSSLAVAGRTLYLTGPGGRVVRLDSSSLRVEQGRAATSPIVDVEQRLPGLVAAAGGEDSPLVVATARVKTGRLCEVGENDELGPCVSLRFRPVAAGSAPTGAVFTADSNGTVYVFQPEGGHLATAPAVHVGAKVHGTLVSSRGKLYVPVERGVAVVDPQTPSLLRVIRLPVTPSSIWVGRFSGQLFATLYGDDRVALVATTRDAPPQLLSGYSRPVAVWGTEGTAYVYSAGDRTICRLDALTGDRQLCREVPDA